MLKNSYIRLLISTFITGLTFSNAIQAAPYELIDLGTLEGLNTYSFAINNHNEVTGTADGPVIAAADIDPDNLPAFCSDGSFREFCTHAFLYSDSGMIDLGDLGVPSSYGLGINDDSTVVGYGTEEVFDADAVVIANRERAMISFSGGQVEAIPYPADLDLAELVQPQQRALDISNDRKVVGFTLFRRFDADAVSVTLIQPYVYDYDTDTLSLIPLFSSDINRGGSARSINSSGVVVGWGSSEDENNPPHAFIWDPASPDFSVDIGTLGGFTSESTAINDNGLVVGVSETTTLFATNQKLAFIYDKSQATPLIALPEFSDNDDLRTSYPNDINNSNQVVGTAQFTTATLNGNTAFLYDHNDGSLTNLNDMVDCSLNWELYNALAINDNGVITGTGVFDGASRSFMLIPTTDTVPTNCTALRKAERDERLDAINEGSGSFGLLSLLLASLVVWRRRRLK